MNRAQAIAKARKLLERYRAEPSTHEGQTALNQALKLMQAHGLTDVDLAPPASSPPANPAHAGVDTTPARARAAAARATPVSFRVKIGPFDIRGKL